MSKPEVEQRPRRGSSTLLRALLAGIVAFTTIDAAPMTAQETPLEANGFERLTSHSELVSFLESLAESSDRISVHTLGSSVEGRRIPYLKVSTGPFGADREHRLVALLFAQQHGNEPSGKEAMLALARDLAVGEYDEPLRSVDLLMVPQVNPDGAERHERQNALGQDLNRSHLILDAPEVGLLRELFHRWNPEVTVDLHEYSPWSGSWLERGWLRLFDEQIGLPTNLNTRPAVRRLAEEGFLSFAVDFLEERGFTAHNYLIGTPEGIRYSTTNVNDGRQGFAILNSLSFIYEGRRGRTPAEDIERRARGQHLAMEALLRFLAFHHEEVLGTVRSARREVTDGKVEEIVLTMSRESSGGSLRIPVEEVRRDGESWIVGDTVVAEIEEYRPLVAPRRTIPLPRAYVIPASHPGLQDLLARHGVSATELEEGEELRAQRIVVEGFVTETLEGTVTLPEVHTEEILFRARPGDLMIPTAQPAGLLVATALDPESMHSLYQYDAFRDLLEPGPFPVLRVP